MQIEQDIVLNAHKTVETMLRDAVNTAKDQNSFATNMAYCQIVATRMLAVLIYNSSVQAGRDSGKVTDLALKGVRDELEEILQAAKEQKLDSVEVQFPQADSGVKFDA